jgi:hypothetical protein
MTRKRVSPADRAKELRGEIDSLRKGATRQDQKPPSESPKATVERLLDEFKKKIRNK